MRIELVVEYAGKAYAGYQRQNNAVTVQQKLEQAYFALTGEEVCMNAAGRTDAGVSAMAQHVHFDTQSRIPPNNICLAMNTKLPGDIRVICSRRNEGFHARYDALGKHYRYTIINRPYSSAIMRDYSWHIPQKLDIRAMREAAQVLVGEHDFAAFAAAGAQTKTTVREIWSIDIERGDGDTITIDVRGNGFLYNMVRIIAGTLCTVGKGKLGAADVCAILEGKKRVNAGETAPPQGLMLVEVYY